MGESFVDLIRSWNFTTKILAILDPSWIEVSINLDVRYNSANYPNNVKNLYRTNCICDSTNSTFFTLHLHVFTFYYLYLDLHVYDALYISRKS